MQRVDVKRITVDNLSFSPEMRGHHELHVKCNDQHICGSPIPVYVTIRPDQIKTTSKPEITPLDDAGGIKCHRGKLMVSRVQKEIVMVDPSDKSIRSVALVPGINEILVDDPYIYATDTKQHRVVKMDSKGTIVKATGRKGCDNGEFNFPNGIRLSNDAEIMVCDTSNHRIQVFDRDLKFIRKIGREGSEDGCFNEPDDLDFDERGHLFVVDQDNNRIQVLTPQGEHIHNIGKLGKGLGELHRPVSVAIHMNFVYITDHKNTRISVFKTTGEFVTTFGEGLLKRPECIAIDGNGYVHVTDDRSRIVTF